MEESKLIFKAVKGQISYGESIGIILMDTFTPFIPGDVGNATTYSFPVRFQVVPGLTSERVLHQDLSALDDILRAGRDLVKNGVKAITGDCGYMAVYQKMLVEELGVPVFMSSLLQVPFIHSMLPSKYKVGIVCANSELMNSELLQAVAIDETRITIQGMQKYQNFQSAMLEEIGILDKDKVEAEVIEAAQNLINRDPMVKAILLECSDLPPYGKKVQEAVGLPVFDFITMINYVHSALVKKSFIGSM